MIPTKNQMLAACVTLTDTLSLERVVPMVGLLGKFDSRRVVLKQWDGNEFLQSSASEFHQWDTSPAVQMRSERVPNPRFTIYHSVRSSVYA